MDVYLIVLLCAAALIGIIYWALKEGKLDKDIDLYEFKAEVVEPVVAAVAKKTTAPKKKATPKKKPAAKPKAKPKTVAKPKKKAAAKPKAKAKKR